MVHLRPIVFQVVIASKSSQCRALSNEFFLLLACNYRLLLFCLGYFILYTIRLEIFLEMFEEKQKKYPETRCCVVCQLHCQRKVLSAAHKFRRGFSRADASANGKTSEGEEPQKCFPREFICRVSHQRAPYRSTATFSRSVNSTHRMELPAD